MAIAVFAIGTIFVIGQAAGMFKSNPKVTDEKGKAQVTVPDILGMTVEEATENGLTKKGWDFPLQSAPTRTNTKKARSWSRKPQPIKR